MLTSVLASIPRLISICGFAKRNGLEYIIIDEGWSDPEDLLIFSDKMDMAGIINYAKQNGVGVILWSSWRNLVQRGHKKMEEIMKHYGDMGVKGFKVDFFDRDDQRQSIRCMRWQNVPPNII